MKTIAILGSTAVIGRLTLDVLSHLGEAYHVRALAAGENMEVLANQIRTWQPECVSVATDLGRAELLERIADLASKPEILVGESGLADVANLDTDVVMSAVVGSAGLIPTWHAVKRGATVALANKESLVAGGDLVMGMAKLSGSMILPVDSEHSALYQCLQGERLDEVERYLITASGGPFREASREEIESASIESALKHPTWKMGKKITIDSATLMNKGFEVIEAHHLFKAAYDRIKVVVHPQSIVHSLVEFTDGSVMAQLGSHDMRLPIQYALTYPRRQPSPWPRLDLAAVGQLTFQEPDFGRFPCLRLAFEAGQTGGFAPCVLNAANEAAVAAALAKRIPFAGIPWVVESVLESHPHGSPKGVSDILEMDKWARNRAESVMNRGGWNT